MTTTNSEQTGTNVNENAESTNILSNREPSDFQPTTPINPVVDKPLNFTPPPIDTIPVETTAKIQTPPISTTAVDKPLNFTPPPIDTIPVERTAKIQTPSISITAVEKIRNSPSTPVEAVTVENKTSAQPVDTTLVIDDPKSSVKIEVTDKTGTGDASGEGACIACLCGTCLVCLCGPACLICCLGVTAIIPLLQLIFGLKYSDECPVNQRIPQYLIVAGAIGLIVIGLPIIKVIVGICSISTFGGSASATKYILRTMSLATHVLNAFTFCWFIAGCVWIFGAYGKVQYNFHDQTNYCNSTLYRAAFWLLILSLIGNVISIYSARKKHEPSKKKAAFTRVPTAEP